MKQTSLLCLDLRTQNQGNSPVGTAIPPGTFEVGQRSVFDNPEQSDSLHQIFYLAIFVLRSFGPFGQ